MSPVFLDTGYVIALESADDQNHEAASNHWRNFPKPLPLVLTTTYVFDEIVTFFNSRSHHVKAVEIGERLMSSPSVQLIHVDETLFFDAWRLFKQREDKSYSLTDCVSFCVMKKFKCKKALSFDKHFQQEGFRLLL